MQDRKQENTGEKDKVQPMEQGQTDQEAKAPFEPINIDRQEGNMNHGTVGGSHGEEATPKTDDQ